MRRTSAAGVTKCRRRGMILLVVLMIISLLALLAASFSFKMNADLAGLRAKQDMLQADLAVRSGIDRAIWVLRDKRTDVDQWYNNQKWFRRIPVWMPGKIGGSESLADQEPVPGVPAWRFSIVSYERKGGNDTAKMRYGLTDEASKININTATRAQLIRLFEQIKPEDVSPEQLADALLDWRSTQGGPNTSANSQLASYYRRQAKWSSSKRRPFDSVDELLMVRWFNGTILYGNDLNRNGYVDDNEKDGPDGAFPPDKGDGMLNPGISPFVTVHSWDWNTGVDNKRRVNINFENFSKPELLPKYITQELSAPMIQFIADARKRGYKFKSPAELLDTQFVVYENGKSNYDATWKAFAKKLSRENLVSEEEQEATQENAGTEGNSDDNSGGTANQGGSGQGTGQNQGQNLSQDERRAQNKGEDQSGENSDKKSDQQTEADTTGDSSSKDRSSESNEQDGSERTTQDGSDQGGKQGSTADQDSGKDESSRQNDTSGSQQKRNPRRNRGIGAGADSQQRGSGRSQNKSGSTAEQEQSDAEQDGGTAGSKSGESSGRDGSSGSEGRSQTEDSGEMAETGDKKEDSAESGGEATEGQGRGTPLANPVSAQDMPVIMDRLTTATVAAIAGLINVNTAPVEVLSTIPGLKREQAESIVSKRAQLSGTEKLTTAWLVSTGTLDPETFALISHCVTTRSMQYKMDVIGFADHVGTMKRVEVVVEMRGQVAQIKYYRDITSLGVGYPIHDDQRSEGFGFSDR